MSGISGHMMDEVKQYVSKILDNQLSENLVFHNKAHTFDVLKNVELMGIISNCTEAEIDILRISALFHDVGYIKVYKGHEQESVLMAKEYLTKLGIDSSVLQQVTTAILSTKVPQNPQDKLSEIVCDADLMHLTYKNYFEQMEFMRQEWDLAGIVSFNEKEFHLNSIQFFNSHNYHTEYGKLILEPMKRINLERIKKRIQEL